MPPLGEKATAAELSSRPPDACDNIVVAVDGANAGCSYEQIAVNVRTVQPQQGAILGTFSLISVDPMLEVKEGRPSVLFLPEIEAQALWVFSHVIIVSFYHGRPTWAECRDAISMWIGHSPHSVAVMDSHTVLIRLRDEAIMLRVLTRDSLLICYFPFYICRWSAINCVRASSLAPVWIAFPKLPLQCYPDIHKIAACLSRVLGMDQPTANLSRLSLARICVEVYPMLDKIRLAL